MSSLIKRQPLPAKLDSRCHLRILAYFNSDSPLRIVTKYVDWTNSPNGLRESPSKLEIDTSSQDGERGKGRQSESEPGECYELARVLVKKHPAKRKRRRNQARAPNGTRGTSRPLMGAGGKHEVTAAAAIPSGNSPASEWSSSELGQTRRRRRRAKESCLHCWLRYTRAPEPYYVVWSVPTLSRLPPRCSFSEVVKISNEPGVGTPSFNPERPALCSRGYESLRQELTHALSKKSRRFRRLKTNG